MQCIALLLVLPLLTAQEKPSQEGIRAISELSPRLRRLVPDLDSRLSTSQPNAWTKVLLDAVKPIKVSPGKYRVNHIGRRDLNLLAPYAVRGARTPEEKEKVCKLVLRKKLTAAIPDVARLIEDPSSSVRASAVFALGALRVENARDRLKKLLSDGSAEVRRAAVISLTLLGDDSHQAELLASVRRADGVWALRSAMALGQAGMEDPSPVLKLLNGYIDPIQVHALYVLQHIHSDSVASSVKELMKDSSPQVREASIRALGQIGGTISREACINLLREGKADSSELAAALYSLGRMGAEDASKDITPFLSNPDRRVRYAASWAIGRFGLKAAAQGLEDNLQDKSWDVRAVAASGLGLINARQSIDGLLNALGDEDPNVRGKAALSLARVGAEDSIARLRKLLNDPDNAVREDVAEALIRLGQRDGVELILNESDRLWVLNALRRPESWKLLANSGIQQDLSGEPRTLVEHLLQEIGLKVEWPSPEVNLRSWAGLIRSGNGRGLALEQLRYILRPQFSIILTDNSTVRVLSWQEALAFWRKWWAEEQQKPSKEK